MGVKKQELIPLRKPPKDNLFGLGEESNDKIVTLSLKDLYPFKNHPFKVLEDEKMRETCESIEKNGVLVPIIARRRNEGGYEIVSGHRRVKACELVGKSEIPVIVKNYTDDEAIIVMVDSNLQREQLLFSEKAWAYRMKLEAMKRQAGRPSKENPRQVVEDYSANILGEQMGESGRNIQRYIRLTYLIPPILDMVDEGKITFTPAVNLSYLLEKEQEMLFEVMEVDEVAPSIAQSNQLRYFSSEGNLTEQNIRHVMRDEKDFLRVVKINDSKLKDYFPPQFKPKDIEAVIFKLLDEWREREGIGKAQENKGKDDIDR
jgi:ParB family chromosome partitioning protein